MNLDELKKRVSDLNKDGKIDFEELKDAANKQQQGLGDHLETFKDNLVGPDGKVSVDDAHRMIDGLGDKANSVFQDVKGKLFGDKK